IVVRYVIASTRNDENFCKSLGRAICSQKFVSSEVNTIMLPGQATLQMHFFILASAALNVIAQRSYLPISKRAYCIARRNKHLVLVRSEYVLPENVIAKTHA